MENKTSNNPQTANGIKSNVICRIGDKVYWDTNFGRYTGKVIGRNDEWITVDYNTPTGNGGCIGDFKDNGDWKKYGI